MRLDEVRRRARLRKAPRPTIPNVHVDAAATPERRTSPWLLAAVFFAVYLLTLQRQLFNDGIFFELKLQLGGKELIYNHILFLPVVKLLQTGVSVVVPISPEFAMKLVAAFAGAWGVALVHLVARRALVEEHQARTTAILTGILMGYWFHSTATEVHSVHAACALLLLLGLVRVLQATDRVDFGTWFVIATGACLTPASHVSGVCVALPVAYVWLRARAPGASR